jgi:hypothetical protein
MKENDIEIINEVVFWESFLFIQIFLETSQICEKKTGYQYSFNFLMKI